MPLCFFFFFFFFFYVPQFIYRLEEQGLLDHLKPDVRTQIKEYLPEKDLTLTLEVTIAFICQNDYQMVLLYYFPGAFGLSFLKLSFILKHLYPSIFCLLIRHLCDLSAEIGMNRNIWSLLST